MKSIYLLLTGLFICHLVPAQNVIKLTNNNFSIYVQDYKGAFDYPSGLRIKVGMSDRIDDNATWNYPFLGIIEGKRVTSKDFTVKNIQFIEESEDKKTILSLLQHKLLPLTIQITISAYDNTGVFGVSTQYTNIGNKYPISLSHIPSFELALPKSEYDYQYLTSGWAQERKLQTQALGSEAFEITSTSGRSSTEYSPWISLHDKKNNIYYNSQLAWSGNWHLTLEQKENNGPNLSFGEYFDNGKFMLLGGDTLNTAEVVFTGAYASIDNAANNLHRYQRHHLLATPSTNDPMLVQFNTWFPFQINISSEKLEPYVDKAADLGIEVFTIDAGWYVQSKQFEEEVGSWNTNLNKFPGGMGEIANYIRNSGMKFGLWFEIESMGVKSELLEKHPDWFLQYNGKPVICEDWSKRRHLNFSHPEVFQWALDQFDKMYEECGGIDWVKLDYNISIGSQFDSQEGFATGGALRNHVLAFYKWLDTLNQKYPDLVLENCSSGALRMDLGILAHTHTSFVSDETSVNPSLGMAWSSTLEYTPRMINHWTVGMGNHNPIIDQTLSKGYWNYMFRVPMNGQFGISSSITDWSPELVNCAKENIELYKTIRTIIADADVYHLTSQPNYNDPQGWTNMLYVTENKQEAVAMINRTGGGENTCTLKIPYLNQSVNYKVEFDGKPYGTMSGQKLATEGLKIQLENYRSLVVTFRK